MNIKNIPLGSPEKFNAFIETPKGSKIKYEIDEELDLMRVNFVFQGDFAWIYNYGLIPQTKAPDNDHLDVYVLGDNPIQSGLVVVCRPIGMIELLDRGQGDNKIIALPFNDVSFSGVNSLEDLPKSIQGDFTKFHQEVGIQKNKKMEILGFHGKERAIEEIKKYMIS